MQMLEVIIITSDDPLYVRRFFERLKYSGSDVNYKIKTIVALQTFRESRINNLFRVFKLYGLIDFTKLLLKYVKILFTNKSLKSICLQNKIQFKEIITTKDINFINWIKTEQPDVILSVSASEIFDKEVFAASKVCSINIHSGRLPIYRGYMPVFWQMYKNEKYITITFHEIVDKVDMGEIIHSELLEIKKNSSLDKMMTEVKKTSADTTNKILNKIAEDRVKPISTPIKSNAINYFSFPSKIDTTIFKNNGFKLI